MLRSGHTIYPLMGEVTERQYMEACDPSHQFEGLLINSHGGKDGILLRMDTRLPGLTNGGQAEVWLPQRAVVAGAQAAGTIKLCVLSSCDGRALAEELFWRAGITTIYSDGSLTVTEAYTLAATFLRRLHTGTLDEALQIADTLGMHWYPVQLRNGMRETMAALQQMASMLATRIDRMEERLDVEHEIAGRRADSLEEKLNGLTTQAVLLPGRRRWLWIMGIVCLVGPFAASSLFGMCMHGIPWQGWAGAIAGFMLAGMWLLLTAYGRLTG